MAKVAVHDSLRRAAWIVIAMSLFAVLANQRLLGGKNGDILDVLSFDAMFFALGMLYSARRVRTGGIGD